MFGVPKGLIICNNGRLDEINQRIESRNVPSQPLKPAFSLRPQQSKYNFMPVVNDSLDLDAKIGLKQYVNYDTKTVFNPGTSAPWYGYANHINTESSLRNQFFALQDCDQAAYIPGSNSSLYVNYNVPRHNQNQNPTKNQEPQMAPFNPNECNLEQTLWQNNTRVAVKNIPM